MPSGPISLGSKCSASSPLLRQKLPADCYAVIERGQGPVRRAWALTLERPTFPSWLFHLLVVFIKVLNFQACFLICKTDGSTTFSKEEYVAPRNYQDVKMVTPIGLRGIAQFN